MRNSREREERKVWKVRGPQPSRLSALASPPKPLSYLLIPILFDVRCARRDAGHDRPEACAPRKSFARRNPAFAILALWLAFLAPLVAAGPLEADLQPLGSAVRVQGPSLIDVTLTPKSPQLVEGTLELRLAENDRTTSIVRRPDIALAGGSRKLRLLLPPSPAVALPFEQTITAIFARGQNEFEIGRAMQNVMRGGSASLLLAVARLPERTNAGLERLWQNLRVERFTAYPQGTNYLSTLSTAPVFLAPADFATDPLTYCAFDAVLFEPGTFNELKEKALDALGTWLAAGGSVCLSGREPLDPAHAALLQQWLSTDPATSGKLSLDPDGRFEPLPNGLLRARVGLGRLIIVESVEAPPQKEVSAEWRNAAAFLWKYRPKLADQIEQNGVWQDRDAADPERNRISQRGGIASELSRSVLPDTFRVMPLPVIIALLVAFMVTVGPLDYFVLGRLRLRKFTWILFPIVSLAFTLLTMKLAAHYLGVNTARGYFTVTDLGLDGRVVRETRCEVVFPARSGPEEREVTHAIEMPVWDGEFSRSSNGVTYTGQFPTRYRSSFPLVQWKPQLFRRTTLGEMTDESGIDWADLIENWPPEPGSKSNEQIKRGDLALILFRGADRLIEGGTPLSFELWEAITLAPLSQPFTGFSQLSPTGDASFSDLPLIEKGDPDFGVIIAIRRDGSNIHAWRRLFHVPSSNP